LSGPEGKLLVDGGFTVSRPALLSALMAISDDPIKQLINTHWHIDHTDGNEWVHAAGAAIRGVTRKVGLDVESFSPAIRDPWGSVRMAVSASTVIDRKDFGLTWNAALDSGGVLVGDEAKIELDVEFVKSEG
jgi:glyoxylase-like metal-dependent hydrolase (beta-lactamase superfamily II)